METLWKKERFRNLSKKNQAYIIVLAFLVFLIPLLLNIVITSLMAEAYNSPNALMLRAYDIEYDYYNNTDIASNITITTDPVENLDDYTQVYIEFNEIDFDFEAHPRSGFIAESEKYPIFWIGKNPYANLVGQNIEVLDVLGIFGDLDKSYEFKFIKRELYWSEDPELMGVQIVNVVELKDGDEVVAEGLIDDDSGLVIYLKGNGIEFILIDSGEFSLNVDAIYSSYIALILMIIIPLLLFYFSRKKNKEDSINILLLSVMGSLAIFTDFIFDVSYYAVFNVVFVMIIHLVILVAMAFICYYHRAIKFIIPSILEFGFFLLLLLLVGGSYFPALTLISGSTLSFIGLVFYSDNERDK